MAFGTHFYLEVHDCPNPILATSHRLSTPLSLKFRPINPNQTQHLQSVQSAQDSSKNASFCIALSSKLCEGLGGYTEPPKVVISLAFRSLPNLCGYYGQFGGRVLSVVTNRGA